MEPQIEPQLDPQLGSQLEAKLEIYCDQSHQTPGQNNTTDNNSCENQNSSPWTQLGLTFYGFFNKIRELTKPDKQPHHKHMDPDWEIPFERIRLCHKDFQSCGSEGLVSYGRLSNSPVAVKRVRDVALTKIRHLKELNHKNIIKFRGVSTDNKFYYIIMEWCPYGTLHDHIHSGRKISLTGLSDFAQQIASGMRYLHSQNIIHRDLKPSNILLTNNNNLKISDFGMHILITSNDKLPVTGKTHAGTYAYMAPEVIRSEPYSFPVDIWSYGVVLWEIMIGEEPYRDLASSAVAWAVGNNSSKLPIPSGFPKGYCRILEGCWKDDPRDRLNFKQICMILKGAVHEVDKIPEKLWLPLQSGWKREVQEELDKYLQPKTESVKSEPCCNHDLKLSLTEELKQKTDDIYLRLQETYMYVQRNKKEIERDKKKIEKEREELYKRENSVFLREQAVAQSEAESSALNHQINNLREQLALMKTRQSQIDEELNRLGISLKCMQDNTNQ